MASFASALGIAGASIVLCMVQYLTPGKNHLEPEAGDLLLNLPTPRCKISRAASLCLHVEPHTKRVLIDLNGRRVQDTSLRPVLYSVVRNSDLPLGLTVEAGVPWSVVDRFLKLLRDEGFVRVELEPPS